MGIQHSFLSSWRNTATYWAVLCIQTLDLGQQNEKTPTEQLWDHASRDRQPQMFCTERRARRKKILLGLYCTSYTMPCLVPSAKATTDATVSGTETIGTGIRWVAVRGKFQCYLVGRRKFPWEALKATGLISPNFWTSYSCICSFISHKLKKSVKEKILFSTLMYCHTLRWKWGFQTQGWGTAQNPVWVLTYITLFTFALK